MRLQKAEIYLFVLMGFIALAGLSAWMAWSVATTAVEAARFSFLSMVMAGLGFIFGALLIYPTISMGVAERGKLKEMTESLSERSQTLERAAVTDALTGLNNRRYFDEAMREYLAAFKQIDKPIGLMLLDLDHFKAINDTHGHDVGDDVLRRVSLCLQEFTRYHDVVARLGGEEFGVLSPNINERQLYDLADRIRNAVSKLSVRSGNVTVKVTVSAGVVIWDGREAGESLYKRADKQLYEAKRSGRNRVSAAA